MAEKFPELADNVKMWSKVTGFTLEHVSYSKDEDKNRNWFLEGSVGEIHFVMNISCTTEVNCINLKKY